MNKNLCVYCSSHVLSFILTIKGLGTLYLTFGFFSGIIGTILSYYIRLELAGVGNQFLLGNHQLYNVIITAYAFIMIFFLLCLL